MYESDNGFYRLTFATPKKLVEAITPTVVPEDLTLTGINIFRD